VDAGFCRIRPTVDELSHDPVEGNLGDSPGKIRPELAGIKILTRYESNPCTSGDYTGT
jgi:hypothetical protein